MDFRKSIIKPAILVFVMALYLVAGFYPIHPLPEFANGAVLQENNVLRFPSAGIAYTQRAPEWLADAIAGSAVDILLDVQPTLINQTGPARILTVSENTGFRNITVGQQADDLIVRLRRSEATFNGTPAFIVANLFAEPDRHTVHINVKPGILAISVDGTKRLTAALPDHAFDTWARDYRLALGNEITFDRPWLGVIRQALVTVNGNRVDYLGPGELDIPATYYLKQKPGAAHKIPFYMDDYSLAVLQDWVVNFFGFIPLGFLFVVFYPGWSNVRRVAIICLGISLVIEATQVFLPWRHPAAEDVILNTLGGGAGAWVGIKYWKATRRQPVAGY